MPAATRERITRAEHEAMPLAAAYIRLQLEQERAEQAAASGRYRWNPRPEQRTPDGDWRIWYIETGRGWGKTRTAAEDVKAFALANPSSRIAVVAPTFDDARDVCVEGESGLLSILPPGAVASWNRSFGQLFLTNGSRFDLYSAEKPDSLRGPQHHRAWGDECAFWRYGPETFANLMLGLRLGHGPRVVLTTTPRPARPLIKDVKSRPNVHITRGSMLDNAANLAPEFVADMLRQYQGTRLGRQEIEGVELDDNPAALWHRANIDANRVLRAPQLRRIVVGVDPAATAAETSSETGIVTAGLGTDGHGYVLDDASLHASPAGWAAAAITAYHKHRANLIVAEVNHGGDMVEHTLASIERLPFKAVRASRGKYTRAEPIASLYERGMVHHVGNFAELEDQLCSWQPGDDSPDRMDALVWALAELFPLQAEAPMIAPVGIARTSPSPMRFV